MEISQKIQQLERIISSYRSVAIAYSGGVDSTYLACVAHSVLGDQAVAITIDTLFTPRVEIESATSMAKQIGLRHLTLQLRLSDDNILKNPRDRCYHCKTIIFGRIIQQATEFGIPVVLDGSNLDDLKDFRPGLKAVRELKVKSPLVEAGFSKDDIREASKQAGLETWNHPSMACLASRIPYGVKIKQSDLRKIEQAEIYLKRLGTTQVRVRVHGESARIEVAPSEREKFFDVELMDQVADKFKEIGFKFVSLDLEGYKTGKLN